MTYASLIDKLYNNHFYPALRVKVKKNEEILEAIEVHTSSLMQDRTVERLREVIGDNFKAEYVADSEIVVITKK